MERFLVGVVIKPERPPVLTILCTELRRAFGLFPFRVLRVFCGQIAQL